MTVHSDWGDWLLRDVESASPDGVALWYLGCNGFVIKGREGTTLFVDPYLGVGDPPRTVRMIPVPFDPAGVETADGLLVTHEHTDHVHGESQAPILAGTDATMVGPRTSLDIPHEEAWADDWPGIDDDQFEVVHEGDAVEIGEFLVHVEGANDPDAEEPVSYLIEHDDGTVFHAGDSRPADAFSEVGQRHEIDVAIVAFGSSGTIPDKQTGEPKLTTWYNDENEILEAASALECDRLLPSHWDMWKGLTADPTALLDHARSFEHPRSLEIVEIGDRVDV